MKHHFDIDSISDFNRLNLINNQSLTCMKEKKSKENCLTGNISLYHKII